MKTRILAILTSIAVTIGIANFVRAQAPAPFINGSALIPSPPVTLTASQINGMFTSPVQIIPAQGAGTVIVPVTCTLNAIFGVAFTGGGNIRFYWGNAAPPINFATTAVTGIIAASFVANSFGLVTGISMTGGNPSAGTINAGLYLSNITGAYVGGAGSSLVVGCQYYVLSGVQ